MTEARVQSELALQAVIGRLKIVPVSRLPYVFEAKHTSVKATRMYSVFWPWSREIVFHQKPTGNLSGASTDIQIFILVNMFFRVAVLFILGSAVTVFLPALATWGYYKIYTPYGTVSCRNHRYSDEIEGMFSFFVSGWYNPNNMGWSWWSEFQPAAPEMDYWMFGWWSSYR